MSLASRILPKKSKLNPNEISGCGCIQPQPPSVHSIAWNEECWRSLCSHCTCKGSLGSGEGIYSKQNLPSTGQGSFPAHPKALSGNAPWMCLISTAKMRFLLLRIHFFPLSLSFAQGQGDSFMSGLLQPREAVAAWENARTASLEKASERYLGLRMAFQELFLKVSDGAVTDLHREELLNQLFFS